MPDARYTEMDATFIQQNQIIERYLMGRLPLKGAQDFERYCRENPDTVTQLGLPDRINAALKLLDASGQPEPWAEKPRPRWQRPEVVIGVAAVAGALLVATLVLAAALQKKSVQLQAQHQELQQQPLLPARSTRPITIKPSRTGPPARNAASIGGGGTELADLRLDVSWSTFSNFRITIDRVEQGRFAVLGNVARDSNGQLRIALNSSALGPGDYTVTIEGLDKWGKPVEQGWTRIGSVR
jgi:hypothetical protein